MPPDFVGLSWGETTGVRGLVTTLVDGDTRAPEEVFTSSLVTSDLSLFTLEVCGSLFGFLSLSFRGRG